MKKCAKCGGSMYKTGGSTMKTTVGSASPKGLIFGIPNAGPTGPNKQGIDTAKNGGPVKKKLVKAQKGTFVPYGKESTLGTSSGSSMGAMARKGGSVKSKTKKK